MTPLFAANTHMSHLTYLTDKLILELWNSIGAVTKLRFVLFFLYFNQSKLKSLLNSVNKSGGFIECLNLRYNYRNSCRKSPLTHAAAAAPLFVICRRKIRYHRAAFMTNLKKKLTFDQTTHEKSFTCKIIVGKKLSRIKHTPHQNRNDEKEFIRKMYGVLSSLFIRKNCTHCCDLIMFYLHNRIRLPKRNVRLFDSMTVWVRNAEGISGGDASKFIVQEKMYGMNEAKKLKVEENVSHQQYFRHYEQ